MTTSRDLLAAALREAHYRILNGSTDVRADPGDVLTDAIAGVGLAAVKASDIITGLRTIGGNFMDARGRMLAEADGVIPVFQANCPHPPESVFLADDGRCYICWRCDAHLAANAAERQPK